MTDDEKRERTDWAAILSDLQKEYTIDRAWGDLSVEEMLMLCVGPPLLNDHVIEERPTIVPTRKRLYLDKIYEWKDFENEVQSFTVPAKAQETGVADDVVFHSLNPTLKLGDEDGERWFTKCLISLTRQVC